jgi:eukaryotic-like serine/threonine-protein kinase
MIGSGEERKQLRMFSCPGCNAKVFIPADLPPLSMSPCPKCGYNIMMPWQLKQFELRVFIAAGGNGAVYRAFDTALQREVALKLMKPEVAKDPTATEAFLREARACASLNHTNIIHIYTFDEAEGQKYIVMEIADEGSLDGRIELYKRLPELDILDVGIKVGSALNLALKHNLLHRDIKPGNILFNADNEPKLVDFGLARKAEAEYDPQEELHGTPYYVAPEKIKREPETFLSDMYSLGATLYHALTGHVPFEAPTVEEVVMAHVNTPLTPPNHVVPEISQAFSDAIMQAMAKNPAERFQSYDEFIMNLEAARTQYLRQQFVGNAVAAKATKGGWWRR